MNRGDTGSERRYKHFRHSEKLDILSGTFEGQGAAFNFYCKEWLSLFGSRRNLEDCKVVFVLIVKEPVSECVCVG